MRSIISKTLPASLELGITALIISAVLGLAVGFSGIARPEGKVDFAGRFYGIGTYALPPFWAAMLIQLVFAVMLGWLPVGGWRASYRLAAGAPGAVSRPEGAAGGAFQDLNLAQTLTGAVMRAARPSFARPQPVGLRAWRSLQPSSTGGPAAARTRVDARNIGAAIDHVAPLRHAIGTPRRARW